MKNLNTLAKIFLFISFSSFAIWFGSYISRNLLIYQFFEPTNLDLKNLFKNQNQEPVFNAILPLLFTNIIAYLSLLFFYTLFLLRAKIIFKNEGWLFIISVIVYLTAPFEFFLLSIDYNIIKGIFDQPQNSFYILSLIKERMTILGSFSMIEIFSYFGVIFLTIFRPLRKINEN